ncbi:MAG: OsmC family peroxiredoxin [Thermoplasmata archaeon]|nr:OsmC family peroxiredoxin [Thermoplasmata archaeon]
MAAKRKADAVWENDLLRGHGKVTGTSGGLPEVAVSWSARTEASGGKTSPEELLAAAHASCFCMALSSTLAKMQHPSERLEVSATCTFDKVGDSWTVTVMEIDVGAKAAGLSEMDLGEAARTAAANCPISRALKGNVDVRVTATRLL